MRNFITIFILLLALGTARAQVSLSVTNYGAVGDATNFTVHATSNSVIFSSAIVWNTNATIGKAMEVYGARISPWLFITNPVDCLGYVTNVTDGTNLYLSMKATIATNVNAILGHNNSTNFQYAYDNALPLIASNSTTNVTLNVPLGNYLCIATNEFGTNFVPQYAQDTLFSVKMQSGGITWQGEGSNSIVTGCGAALPRTNTDNVSVSINRGSIFGFGSQLANFQDAITFRDMTIDGGLATADRLNIAGRITQWDQSHSGIFFYPKDAGSSGPALVQLLNCNIQHWAGEMVKMGIATTNSFLMVSNCYFWDGSGSCLNPNNFGMRMVNSFANSTRITIERDSATVSSNSIVAFNTFHLSGDIALVGVLTNHFVYPLLIASNYMEGVPITLAMAQKVTIQNNTLTNGSFITFSSSPQPSDGTQDINSNIVIVANAFSQTIGPPLYLTGAPINGLFVTNNTGVYAVIVGGSPTPAHSGGYKTNIVFSGNSGPAQFWTSGLQASALDSRNVATNTGVFFGENYPAGQYFLDVSNNWTGLLDQDNAGISNNITYGAGSFHNIQLTHAGASWVLDDSLTNQVPTGALLVVSNSTGSTLPLKTSSTSAGITTNLANNAVVSFSWAATYWTNGTPYVPPVVTVGIYLPILR